MMRAGGYDGGGSVPTAHYGRGVSSGSPPPPPLPPPGPAAAPPGGGVPPPRPPGLAINREVPDRSRAVRFESALKKIRSRSSDDALLAQLNMGSHEEEADGPKTHHNISVAVRCRGLLPQEARDGGRAIVKVLDGGYTVVLEDPHTTAADDYLRINKSKERQYSFDEALGPHASQQEVYSKTTKVLIGGVLEGFNSTVFAYGATSAGKTHTMLGTLTEPGIMMMTLHDLFSEVAVQQEDRVFAIKCSFLEVYNENIRDLLCPESDYLDIREDPVKGMCVAGISEVGGLDSANEIMMLLHQANRQRTTESTGANAVSSRSHAVLQVVVEQRERTAGIVAQVNVGKLSMIDLAGSERASQTNNKGLRMIEGANINRSLLALGNCITALSSGVAFVPYRDSKMTRLLKDSLGGNCRTVMIANVSPCHLNYEDTHNTLKYASRAKNIRTKAMKNVEMRNYHLSKYTEIIKELKGEISELKTKLASEGDLLDLLPAMEPPLSGEAAEEQAELEAAHQHSTDWKQELMANFEERVRIKRQLIDLAHVAQNQMVQKSRAQVGISQWEATQVPSQTAYKRMHDHDAFVDDAAASGTLATTLTTEMPQGVRDLQEQLQLIRTEMANTEETTRGLEQQLVENLKVADRLQAELPTRVPNKDMRAFLGLVYRIYVLEVENIDLQEMNDVTQPLLQQKELEAEALRLQIRMRDRMIEEQDLLLGLGSEELPPKPPGWEVIPAKPTRRPPSFDAADADGEEESPQRHRHHGRGHGADGQARMGRSRRARSAGPDERVQTVVLPPLVPTRGARFISQPSTDRAQLSPVGGLSQSPISVDHSELPPLDIAGRGLGAAPPHSAENSQRESPALASPHPPQNDVTRLLPHGAAPPLPSNASGAQPMAPFFSVEGHPAMPADRRPPQYAGPNSSVVGGTKEERSGRSTRSDTANRRKRKNRREREREAARRKQERLQQQLHIEAASLQRYDLQPQGRTNERQVDEYVSDDRCSSDDRTPPRQRPFRKGQSDSPYLDCAAPKDLAAKRQGVIEKLNRRMKASPPKSLT